MSEPKAIFRDFAFRAISNSHSTMKLCWLALFAGGTVRFIISLDELLRCSGFLDSGKDACKDLPFMNGNLFYIRIFTCLVLYISYGMIFFRFYIGNSRTFDIRYLEIIDFAKDVAKNNPEEERIFKGLFEYGDARWRNYEGLYIIYQTLIIVLLCTELNMPLNFCRIYVLLIVFDIAWILSRLLVAELRDSQDAKTYFKKLLADSFASKLGDETLKKLLDKLPSKASVFWLKNNASFGIALVVILFIYGGLKGSLNEGKYVLLCSISSIAIFLNCVIDVFGTYDFYVPQFSVAYNEIPKDK